MVILFAGYLLKNGSLQTDKTMYDIVSDNWYLFYDYSIINSLDYFMELILTKQKARVWRQVYSIKGLLQSSVIPSGPSSIDKWQSKLIYQ